MRLRTGIISIFLAILGAGFLFACTPKPTETIYTMGFTPSENAQTVAVNAKIMADLLFNETGVKLKTYVASDYTALIEAMRGGKVDFAWLAPFQLVLAEKHAGARVLLKCIRGGKDVFYSGIIVRSDKPYKKIEDLKGKNMAWVDPASSSGFIVPKASLLSDGIDPDKFFGRQIFAGGHDSVVLGVINGSVDAGATFMNEPEGKTGAWTMLFRSRPEFKKKIRVVYASHPIPNDTFATTTKMYENHRDVVDKVTSAISGMHKSTEGKKALMDLYAIDSMVPAQSSEFEMLRKAAAKLDVKIGDKKSDSN